MPTLVAERAPVTPHAGLAERRAARILIIDDQALMTRLLEFILDRGGYATLKANSGARGLDLASSFRPDAIVLDVQMPDLNGLQVLQRLRGDPAHADTVVLVLTAGAFAMQAKTLLDAGANAHCFKPIAPTTLLRKLRELGVPPTLPAPV